MQRAASHRPFSVALDNHPTEVDQDVISSRSFRSAKTSTSSKSRKSVRSNSSGRATSKVKSDDGAGKPNGSQASIADNASSGGASASGSSSSKSGRTETPGRVNSTVTSKQQRMLIDAVNAGQPRKSTVASTRDPLDYTDDEFMMSDARDEPFEDDFEIDFQMLKVDQAVAPPWAAANTNSQSMYIPPSAQELIIGLKHSLDNVEKARRKMEQRYLEEMHKRIALEDELARLRRCITLGSIPLSNNNS
ncbi:hypothetical protein ONZ45_g1891 [Pleurotus djamor]|nr:hypothetical protein ONZ45_g1891 [Pleurotus djamor]